MSKKSDRIKELGLPWDEAYTKLEQYVDKLEKKLTKAKNKKKLKNKKTKPSTYHGRIDYDTVWGF